MPDFEKIKKMASQVRRDILRMTNGSASGHPGGSLGCTDFFCLLFGDLLKFKLPFDTDGLNEDLFFLSNGHISPVYYSVLARHGFFNVSELSTFRKINSRLQGHPATMEHLPGIRVASGSLGQGLSVAIGAALSKKLNNDPFLVYSLHGDGELQEGQIWEAALFAQHHKVDNLIATVDVNGKQIDGPTDSVITLGDLRAKWEAFGWTVWEVDGHNLLELYQVLMSAKSNSGKGFPQVILMKTIMGKGVDFMEDDHKWHGVAPDAKQLSVALTQLEETFGDY